MKQTALLPLLAALTLTAGPAPGQADKKPAAPVSPGEIAAAAPATDWVDIAPDDLLVMTLAPDAKGKPRRVIMQLMPAPFSQGWVSNVRTLAKAHWYDGNAIYRVQDNYVTQWGDPNADDEKKAKKLPDGLKTMPESDYLTPVTLQARSTAVGTARFNWPDPAPAALRDAYAPSVSFWRGWPLGGMRGDGKRGEATTPKGRPNLLWPLHCNGAVGVARGQRPNTGDGTSLYTVNGHAPRHLDRNIAVVGRIIEGMEFLSGLPRGTETLGFYKEESDYVPILSVRFASELPAAEQPHLQYLSTETKSFAAYMDARENRRDAFFVVPAGGADICNIPVPIRRKP